MKKSIRRALAALIGVTILATSGCGAKEEAPAENNDAAVETEGSAEPLRIAVNSEPDNLNPMLSAASDTGGIMANVYEGLLTYDTDGNFLPCLATGLPEVMDDGLSYKFTLKEGINFHTGEEMTSADVKYTYDTIAGLSGSEPLSKTFGDLFAAVEAPDATTVIFRLKHLDAGFLTRCVIPVQQKDYPDDATKPNGTGPYKFVEYIPGQKLILEAYPEYHTCEDRIPEVKNVEFRVMTDNNAILMALKSGGLDIAQLDPANVDVLGEDFEVVEGLSNAVQLVALNNTVAPLDDVRVRQAMNYAVNKEEIINTVTKGHGARVDSFLSPRMQFFFNDEMTVYEQDLEKAKSLLTEAGYPDGFEITVTVPSNYQVHVDAAQVLKHQLEQVGIILDIELVEWAQWLENVYKKADYEMSIVGHTGKLDAQDFLNRFQSTYGKNYFKYNNPEYDELIVAAASTTDQNARAEYYKECQQMLVDDAAAIYIQDPYLIYAVSTKYENMLIYPVTFYDMGSVRYAK